MNTELTREYKRPVRGTARYPEPVEPGTILGPTDVTREYLVALGTTVDGRTVVGYAQEPEIAAALERDPRSVVEVELHRQFTAARQRARS